jgi:hypothetical protein
VSGSQRSVPVAEQYRAFRARLSILGQDLDRHDYTDTHPFAA